MLKTPLGRFRAVALAEGVSFLVLLGVAMPLKHLAGWPWAVLVVGWAHGLLFIAYFVALWFVWRERRWPWSKVAVAAAASVVPGGTFWFDRKLRREEPVL